MSERGRHSDRGTAGRRAGGPVSRTGRKRRSSAEVWLGIAAVVLVAVAAGGLINFVLMSSRAAPKTATKPVAPRPLTTATPAGTSTAKPATATVPAMQAAGAQAQASVTSAESAGAVRAAALRYPHPPAISPLTITRAHPKRRLVAITLDDGIPFDTKILDLLESHGVRCTTFLLGQAVSAHPDLVKRLNKDGFEIANHTYDHKTLTHLSDSAVLSEWSRTQALISAITGNQAPYMRPPGGATSVHLRMLAASKGYHVVLWDKSFADTSIAATPQRMFHNVMDTLQPGDIILCHWGAGRTRGEATYEALKLILPEMAKRGFTPVTLSEMLADSPGAK